MLLAFAGVLLALLVGCVVAPTTRQLHGDIPVSASNPTLIVNGPARGHWTEQDEGEIVVYVVPGNDCAHLAFSKGVEVASRGRFSLSKGESFCAMPLRLNQHVLFHAEAERQ